MPNYQRLAELWETMREPFPVIVNGPEDEATVMRALEDPDALERGWLPITDMAILCRELPMLFIEFTVLSNSVKCRVSPLKGGLIWAEASDPEEALVNAAIEWRLETQSSPEEEA